MAGFDFRARDKIAGGNRAAEFTRDGGSGQAPGAHLYQEKLRVPPKGDPSLDLDTGITAFPDLYKVGAPDRKPELGVPHLLPVDGDGALAAVVANDYWPNTEWLNDGSGTFADSGQDLGGSDSRGISLGDVDGDGDLDAFVANYDQPNKVWVNTLCTTDIDSCVSDIDKDGDVDGQDLATMAAEFGSPDCQNQLITKVMKENEALKKENSRLKAQLASIVIEKEKIKESSGNHFQRSNINEYILSPSSSSNKTGGL